MVNRLYDITRGLCGGSNVAAVDLAVSSKRSVTFDTGNQRTDQNQDYVMPLCIRSGDPKVPHVHHTYSSPTQPASLTNAMQRNNKTPSPLAATVRDGQSSPVEEKGNKPQETPTQSEGGRAKPNQHRSYVLPISHPSPPNHTSIPHPNLPDQTQLLPSFPKTIPPSLLLPPCTTSQTPHPTNLHNHPKEPTQFTTPKPSSSSTAPPSPPSAPPHRPPHPPLPLKAKPPRK